MNIENVLRTAEALERSRTYGQEHFWQHCGSPGCVGGHAVFACTGRLGRRGGDWSLSRGLLGLNDNQGWILFSATAAEWPEPYRTAVQRHDCRGPEAARVAAALLRAMVEFGPQILTDGLPEGVDLPAFDEPAGAPRAKTEAV